MYDQSFNTDTLHRELRKSDFRKYDSLYDETEKASAIVAAVASASSLFSGTNPLQAFHHKKRTLFRVQKFADELVVRKLTRNLRYALGKKVTGRDTIVRNLLSLIEEGVPYRVYRLDIKSFYESINQDDLLLKVRALRSVGPVSLRLLDALIQRYSASNGKGVPRGLAISAILAEVALRDFDNINAHRFGVYFYARYVDDIVIVTNNSEDAVHFLQQVEISLPVGLKLNQFKTQWKSVHNVVSAANPPLAGASGNGPLCLFEFLGYDFSVHEPPKISKKHPSSYHRHVAVEISSQKIKKIKTRIVRSFSQYEKDRDFNALSDRLTYLTSNFSIHDYNTGKRKLAGIFFGYPQLDSAHSKSLGVLDSFLRNAVLSKSGRLYSKTTALLSSKQKRLLLSKSFVRGHTKRVFVNFTMTRIGEIQRCWINE